MELTLAIVCQSFEVKGMPINLPNPPFHVSNALCASFSFWNGKLVFSLVLVSTIFERFLYFLTFGI